MPKTTNTKDFICRSNKIHGNKYDYSKVEYKAAKEKVSIICKKHGEFWQTPNVHLSGKACRLCGLESRAGKRTLSSEEFIQKALSAHGNKYNYSETLYIGMKQKVKIICPVHGAFEQSAGHHIEGHGCSRCYGKCKDITTKEFIEKARLIHGNRYDYSLVEYVNNRAKIKIICKEHGEFEQTPDGHQAGKGCKDCKKSKGEIKIKEYLNLLNIKYDSPFRFDDCKNIKALPFDFYLPSHNLCIEYDGEQHFKPIIYWKGKEGLKTQQIRDQIKTEYCKEKGIKLLRIPYIEFKNIEVILREEIK